MAREAPLIAELGRFPISEKEQNIDSGDWLSQADFDPRFILITQLAGILHSTIRCPSGIISSENNSRFAFWKISSTRNGSYG